MTNPNSIWLLYAFAMLSFSAVNVAMAIIAWNNLKKLNDN